MSSPQATSRTIEDRIRAIEDRLEILNLIASHPPSADSAQRWLYTGVTRAAKRLTVVV